MWLAVASSAMEARLSSVCSSVMGSGVAGDVVGAGQNHHHLGLQRNHILTEAHQHLRRGLPADAAVNVGLAGKEPCRPV